jgi:hypothetical protein
MNLRAFRLLNRLRLRLSNRLLSPVLALLLSQALDPLFALPPLQAHTLRVIRHLNPVEFHRVNQLCNQLRDLPVNRLLFHQNNLLRSLLPNPRMHQQLTRVQVLLMNPLGNLQIAQVRFRLLFHRANQLPFRLGNRLGFPRTTLLAVLLRSLRCSQPIYHLHNRQEFRVKFPVLHQLTNRLLNHMDNPPKSRLQYLHSSLSLFPPDNPLLHLLFNHPINRLTNQLVAQLVVLPVYLHLFHPINLLVVHLIIHLFIPHVNRRISHPLSRPALQLKVHRVIQLLFLLVNQVALQRVVLVLCQVGNQVSYHLFNQLLCQLRNQVIDPLINRLPTRPVNPPQVPLPHLRKFPRNNLPIVLHLPQVLHLPISQHVLPQNSLFCFRQLTLPVNHLVNQLFLQLPIHPAFRAPFPPIDLPKVHLLNQLVNQHPSLLLSHLAYRPILQQDIHPFDQLIYRPVNQVAIQHIVQATCRVVSLPLYRLFNQLLYRATYQLSILPVCQLPYLPTNLFVVHPLSRPLIQPVNQLHFRSPNRPEYLVEHQVLCQLISQQLNQAAYLRINQLHGHHCNLAVLPPNNRPRSHLFNPPANHLTHRLNYHQRVRPVYRLPFLPNNRCRAHLRNPPRYPLINHLFLPLLFRRFPRRGVHLVFRLHFPPVIRLPFLLIVRVFVPAVHLPVNQHPFQLFNLPTVPPTVPPSFPHVVQQACRPVNRLFKRLLFRRIDRPVVLPFSQHAYPLRYHPDNRQ